MKYQLKSQPHDNLVQREKHDQICIGCGKRDPITITVFRTNTNEMIRPNSTARINVGLIGPRPGSWLGCKLGSHDYYLDYEVEAV